VKTTISVIRAGLGSFPGRSRAHPRLLEEAAVRLRAQEGDLLVDSFVTHCGDELELVMTHGRGVDDGEVRRLAHEVLAACAQHAARLKLHLAARDLVLPDGAGGDGMGTGPGLAEMEFEERASDPVLLFMTAGAGPGALNLHLYRAFADPFTTPGLAIDPALREGFVFEVHDLAARRKALFRTPGESYDLLALIGGSSRFVVKRVLSNRGAIAAATSAGRPDLSAGGFAGQDDPVMIVRAESGFPAVGDLLGAFTTPSLAGGWTAGSCRGPLMPVGVCDANRTAFDGPPRATCLGFQVSDGRLVGPADLFDDPAFDPVRRRCLALGELLRAQGPFEPHRRPPSGTEDPVLTGDGTGEDRWEPFG
jgi:fructose 1,6-bisphosphate aldolase/phosphatase